MAEYRVTVHGDPGPQGSKTLMRGRLVESSKRVKPWRAAVVQAVRGNSRIVYYTEHVPVEVDIVFYLQRPASHYGTGRNAAALRGDAPGYPVSRRHGDLDKLCRSTLDALVEAQVLHDDSQVADLATAKRYAEIGGIYRPGAVIRVTSLQTVR